MKALILNSLKEDDRLLDVIRNTVLTNLDQSYKIEWIDLWEKNIEYCNGCGYCGYSKPGICVKNDDMQDIFPRMAKSELQIFISTISFGGYDSVLKKVLDRYCPLGVVTYEVYRGELHHPSRYPNPASLMSIGVQSNEDSKQGATYKLVAERMEVATFVEKAASVVLNRQLNDGQIKAELIHGLEKVMV